MKEACRRVARAVAGGVRAEGGRGRGKGGGVGGVVHETEGRIKEIS